MRKIMIAVAAVVLVLAAGAAYWLLRGDEGEPADTARRHAEAFLDAWPSGTAEEADVEAAASLTSDPEAAASLLESAHRNMDAAVRTHSAVGPSQPVEGGENRTVAFTAAYQLGGELGEWSFTSEAVLVPAGKDEDGEERWTVRWDPALVHPELADGQTLVRAAGDPERGSILAAGGEELAGPGAVWNISLWPAKMTEPESAYQVIDAMGFGVDIAGLAERVEEADPDQAVAVITLRESDFAPHRDALTAVDGIQFAEGTRTLDYHARSVMGGVDPATGEGTSGLQQRYQEQLAGTPAVSVVLADRESGDPVRTLVEASGAADGADVRTTLDLAVQRAAEQALAARGQTGSIVAVRPSTGEILALADHPEGLARSAEGRYPPGSGFKIVTSAALLEQGATTGTVLGCPKYETVSGQRFHNQDEFELGPDTTLHTAFTESCNTTFIGNRDRFADDTLATTAEAFGVGGTWDAGLTTFDGSVPAASGANDLAASLIGQARVETSPLGMAAVAATVAAGEFHQPVLVPDAAAERYQPALTLSPSTYEQLRTMMRATVTEGSGFALRGVPGAAHAKTGTAEFAAEDGELSTHAWIVGFLGDPGRDLAFAVLLEDGGSGGADAGPVAADFLNALG